MARQSSINTLPAEIRQAIANRIEAGHTIDEVTAHINALGHEVSRSAVGRYSQRIGQATEKIRQSREIAEAIVKEVGDESSQTHRLNIELMHGVITDLVMPAQEGEPLDPAKVMFLAKAVQALVSASKSDVDRIEKLRKLTLQDAAKTVEVQAKSLGLTPETIAVIKAGILGIAG